MKINYKTVMDLGFRDVLHEPHLIELIDFFKNK